MGLIIDLFVENAVQVLQNTWGLHLTAGAWSLVGGFFTWSYSFAFLDETLNENLSLLLSVPLSLVTGFLVVASVFTGLILFLILAGVLAVPLIMLLGLWGALSA